MSELDELRRIAYGRTSNPTEEAAAAEARATLAVREFENSLQVDVATPARAEDPAAPVPRDAARVTLDIVDVSDDPGYFARLAATWRVWAVPALAAFVLGVVLSVASGILIFRSATVGDEGRIESVTTEGIAAETGDLEAAMATLERPRESKDVIVELDGSLDSESTRLLRAFSSRAAYAAMSEQGEICLIVISGPEAVDVTCAPPSGFPARGLALAWVENGETVRLHWDGREVVATAGRP